jgi:hypothetical protein
MERVDLKLKMCFSRNWMIEGNLNIEDQKQVKMHTPIDILLLNRI